MINKIITKRFISGIYKITNKINQNCYIGSAICLHRRIYLEHFPALKLNRHYNSHLQHAYNKYSEINFIVEILEYCDKLELLIREQYYIDSLNPQYNICKTAGSALGVIHSKETRERISKAKKGKKIKTYIKSPEHINKISNTIKERNKLGLYGKLGMNINITEEKKKQISQTLKAKYLDLNYQNNFKGHKHTQESLKINRDKHLGLIPWNAKEIVAFNIKTYDTISYETTGKVFEEFGKISINYLIKRRKYYKDYIFFYKHIFNEIKDFKTIIDNSTKYKPK